MTGSQKTITLKVEGELHVGIKALDLWIHQNKRRRKIANGFWLIFASALVDDELVAETKGK